MIHFKGEKYLTFSTTILQRIKGVRDPKGMLKALLFNLGDNILSLYSKFMVLPSQIFSSVNVSVHRHKLVSVS